MRLLLLLCDTVGLRCTSTVEIHAVRVEFRSVHAGEFALAVDQHAAAAAHAGAVDHDRVQADERADVLFRVMSATAFIMGMGPTASTRSMRVPFSISCRSLSVTKPLSA